MVFAMFQSFSRFFPNSLSVPDKRTAFFSLEVGISCTALLLVIETSLTDILGLSLMCLCLGGGGGEESVNLQIINLCHSVQLSEQHR